MTDRKSNDRFKSRFRKARDGKTRRYTAHETDAHDAEEDPNSEEEESCEEESDSFEREMDELASGGRIGRHFERSRRGTGHHQGNTRKVGGENEEPRLPAFLVSLFSHNFWFATVILERHWPRKRENKT